MANELLSKKWGSLMLVCVTICLWGCSSNHVASSDDAQFEDLVAEGALRQFAMAWISDIHLQPLYSTLPCPEERCGKPSREPTNSSEPSRRQCLEMETAPELGRAGCGSSPRLLDETLNFLEGLVAESHAAAAADRPPTSSTVSLAAKAAFTHYPLPPITTILLTGDYALSGRDVDLNYLERTIKEFTKGVFEHFPQQSTALLQGQGQINAAGGIQLLLVVGNHDIPLEALLPPKRTEWAKVLYDIWKPALPEGDKTRETFLRGMYYSTTLRSAPKVRVLCLNTTFYAVKLRKAVKAILKSGRYEAGGEDVGALLHNVGEDEAEEADPAGQFEWLEGELRSARARRQQVVICGHIKPSLSVRLNELSYFGDSWESQYTARYRELISAYSDVVVAQFYGHSHEGTMVALLPPGTQPWKAAATAGPRCNPLHPNLPTALFTIPSVSPQNGNNPTMRVLVFDEMQDNHQQPYEYGERRDMGATLGAYFLADYAQYHLPLYGFVGHSGFGRTNPAFEFESSFHDTFRPFLRCAKPRQPGLEDAANGRKNSSASGGQRCIDGSTALQVAEAVGRSPFAYAAYNNHRYAGGKDVASAAVSCSSLALTKEDFLECISQIKMAKYAA